MSTRTSKRADIQGLRMVAVVAVVINHLYGKPKGGFVGVDVFFVISGYLITDHLLREFTRTRRISISGFYRRRARRLLPAALTVTILTIVAAQFVFTGSRYHQTWLDGAWSSIFWANWHFIHVGTNYFTASAPKSPFQHYWSLSVEEQFYLAWPVILFVVGWVLVKATGGRHEGGARRAAGAIAALGLSVLCLAYAFHLTTANPTAAYFSTFARGWELGLGAVLACVAGYVRGSDVVMTILSWTGTAMIGASLFIVSGNSDFPAPDALLPCLGAVLVLAASSPDGDAYNVLLTNRVSVFIGDISYSVYLVHFPVIILLAEKMPNGGKHYDIAALCLSFGLAAVLYSGVEKPILNSTFLLPGAKRHRSDYPLRDTALAGFAVVAAGLVVTVLWPGQQGTLTTRYEAINAGSARPAAVTQTESPAQAALTTAINAALTATAYPALSPSLDSVISGPEASPLGSTCANIVLQPSKNCTFGDQAATHLAYLVGDSTSAAYTEAFEKMAPSLSGWKFRDANAFGCNFDAVVMRNADVKAQNGCAAHTAAVVAEIKTTKPDVVIITNTYAPRVAVSGATLDDAAWSAALQREVALISADVKKIVLLAPPPDGNDPTTCYKPGVPPIACAASIPDRWNSRAHAEAILTDTFSGSFVSSAAWFCNASAFCPIFVGTTPTKHDMVHAAIAYDDKIWPVMLESLQTAKVFAS